MNKTEKLTFRVFFEDCQISENTFYEAIDADGDIVFSSKDSQETQRYIDNHNKTN